MKSFPHVSTLTADLSVSRWLRFTELKHIFSYISAVCYLLLGLIYPRFCTSEPRHVSQWTHLPDHQSHSAAQPPSLHGAGAPQEDRCQHLQQAGQYKRHHTKPELVGPPAQDGQCNTIMCFHDIVSDFWFLQSFTQSLKRRMSLKNSLYSCGVTYEIVSNIPKVKLWFLIHEIL